MSFIDCIKTAVETGAIKQDKAQEAIEAYQKNYDRLSADGADGIDADAKAGQAAIDSISRDKGFKSKQKLLTIKKVHEFKTEMDKVSDADLPRWIRKFMDDKVEARYSTRNGEFQAILDNLIEEYRPKFVGLI